MKLIIDIHEGDYHRIASGFGQEEDALLLEKIFKNGTPIPDNATNGDVIKAIFDNDKVSEFMGYVRIMARVGNWFNEGVVAEFDKEWWNAPYQKGGE
jgi:hypothetical protein